MQEFCARCEEPFELDAKTAPAPQLRLCPACSGGDSPRPVCPRCKKAYRRDEAASGLCESCIARQDGLLDGLMAANGHNSIIVILDDQRTFGGDGCVCLFSMEADGDSKNDLLDHSEADCNATHVPIRDLVRAWLLEQAKAKR